MRYSRKIEVSGDVTQVPASVAHEQAPSPVYVTRR